MDNITLSGKKTGWLSGGGKEIEQKEEEKIECSISIEQLSQLCDTLVNDTLSVYKSTKMKNLNDALIHLERAHQLITN